MQAEVIYSHEDGLLEALIAKSETKKSKVTEEMKKKASTPSKDYKPKKETKNETN